MEVLLAFLVGLAVIMVVGHGLWLFFAMMFRALTGTENPKSAPIARRCPCCALPLIDATCGVCNWPGQGKVAEPNRVLALQALSAQVERLKRLGVFDGEASEQLLQTVAAQRARVDRFGTATAAPPETQATAREPVVESIPVVPAASVEPEAPGNVAEDLVEVEIIPETVRVPTPPVHQEVSVTDRVAAYQARQKVASPDPPPAPPAAPVRSWGDWLAGFMEERNIRWGELIGGLLIVCGSIALVISFWSAIAERPWMKFLLFNGVTAALFGLGLQSEHRWRLHMTGQGLLTIAGMLVPLNFLAIAAFSSAPGADGWLTIVGELVSAGLFAALLYYAGKTLVDGDAPWLTLGILLPSLGQLLVRRFVHESCSVATLATWSALPTAMFAAVNFFSIRWFSNELMPSERQVKTLLRFLGLTSFAVALPIALLLVKSGHPINTLRELPGLAAALGMVPLAAGLLVWQKLAGRSLAALRTVGTSVAVFGAGVSLLGLVVGWPEPQAMLPSAIIEFLLFTFIAWRFGMPAAHLLAAACLTLAYVLGAQLAAGSIEWSGNEPLTLAWALISGRTGTLLSPLVLGYAGAAFLSWKRGTPAARMLALSAALIATVSVALVSWFGFGCEGDPFGAGWVYLLYAGCALVASSRSRRWVVAWLAIALLLAGTIQEVVFHFGQRLGLLQPEITALLLFCTLLAGVALAVRQFRLAREESPLTSASWQATLAASIFATAGLVWFMASGAEAFEAWHWVWLSAIWLAVALATRWLPVWALVHIGFSLSATFAVAARLARQTWFQEGRWPWLDPWSIQAVALALVGVNLGWAVLRIVFQRIADRGSAAENENVANRNWRAPMQGVLASPWLSGDRVSASLLTLLVFLLSAYAAMPGVLQELSPRVTRTAADGIITRMVPSLTNFELPAMPHQHAADLGGWLLIAGVLVLVAAILRVRCNSWWLACLFIAAAAMCPLVASRFENQVAVASALRWLSAGVLLAGSIPIWARNPLSRWARQLGWHPMDEGGHGASALTALVFVLGLLGPAAMGIAIGVQAMLRSNQFNTLVDEAFGLAFLAGAALVIAAILWFGGTWASRQSRTGFTSLAARPNWPGAVASLLVVLGLAPLVSLVLYHVGIALRNSPILGPDPNSIFFRMGLAGSYAVPILMAAGVLVGYAIRERSANFALAGGLVLNLGATAAYLLAISKGGLVFDAAQWIRLAQLNAAVAAGYLLAWIAATTWHRRGVESPAYGISQAAYQTQAALPPVLLALPIIWSWAQLLIAPRGDALGVVVAPQLVDVWGWLCLALVAVAVYATTWSVGRRVSLLGISTLLVALNVYVAGTVAHWDVGNWLAFKSLLIGHGLVGLGMVGVAWVDVRALRRRRDASGSEALANPVWAEGVQWVMLQIGLLLMLSFRAMVSEPWWSCAGFVLVGGVLLPASAWVFQGRRYLYLAAPLLMLAGNLALDRYGWVGNDQARFYWNVLLLALPAPGWLFIELKSIRHREFAPRFNLPPAHRVATRLSILGLALAVGTTMFRGLGSQPIAPPIFGVDWLALAVVTVASMACLWDVKARDGVALLYLLGLVAVGVLLNSLRLTDAWLLWTGTLVLAAYTLATSYLWSRRVGLQSLARRVGIPRPELSELSGLAWLVPCNLFLVAVVVLLTVAVIFTNDTLRLRVLAAQATLTQVVSVALLARGDRRGLLQLGALKLGWVGVVLFGWAWLDFTTSPHLLDALVIVAAAAGGMATFYGLGLSKLLRDSSDWLAPARQITPWLAAGSGLALIAVLGVEITEFIQTDAVLIGWPAILVVAITLVGLTLAALAAAVLPGRDPLGLSERGRTLYVYGAELVLALLFVHVRITMPWMFRGFFLQFWPLIVMAIAFLGVGVAEICRRKKQEVLARPLENTGVLLPVLPVASYWIGNSSVDYSLVLVCVGLLYAGLSVARRSFGFGVLAAVAANGGLWFFLDRQDGLGFFAHPQVWLIPPALCVLAAAYLNRKQLSDGQMTAVRYGTTTAIYVSSTADIFMNGVANAPWLPLVLGGLAIIGILAGILLRVRAFLFLGTSFLLLSLFTIIWHAAVDLEQTWIWYACVVVAGLLIFALFAVFEKKRQELMKVVEQLKQWDA